MSDKTDQNFFRETWFKALVEQASDLFWGFLSVPDTNPDMEDSDQRLYSIVVSNNLRSHDVQMQNQEMKDLGRD